MATTDPNKKYSSVGMQPISTVPDPNKQPLGTAKTGLQPIASPSIPSPTKPAVSQGLPPINPTPIPSPTQPTTMGSPSSTQAAEYAAWKTKQNELFSKLEGLANSQFTYDPETDPAYQAQRNLAKLRAGDANRATMETMNDRGLLQSTVTNSQLDQNNQRAEQEAQAYIPQYRAEEYNQFQDRLKGARELLDLSSSYGDTAYNRDYQTGRDAVGDAYNEAQLTGVYQSPEAKAQINNLLELKRQAETKGITAEQRAALSKQADGIRAKLSSMGVDISQLGANVNSSKANAAAGVQTLAGQNQAFNQAQQAWENNFNQAQFDESKAARIWEQAFQEKNFAQSMKDAAASRGLQWASLNQRDKEFVADQAWREKQFEYQKSQDVLKNSPQSAKAEDYYSYIDSSPSAFTKDEDNRAVQNNDVIENMILTSGLSETEMSKLYRRYGIPMN